MGTIFKIFIFLGFFSSLFKYCETDEERVWPPPRNNEISYELDPETRDTVNRTVYGYKQGKWYIHKGNNYLREIIDTVYYRNDTELVQTF